MFVPRERESNEVKETVERSGIIYCGPLS